MPAAAMVRRSGAGCEPPASRRPARRDGVGDKAPAQRKTGKPAGASVSARSIARDMTTERSSGSARVGMVNAIVETASPALIEARLLIDQFHAMMRTRKPEKLEPWIAAAKESYIAAFAAWIETDEAAVRAAIIELWSSGRVEGQVNRLKLVKRQMYGRANHDLLKARLTGRITMTAARKVSQSRSCGPPVPTKSSPPSNASTRY